MLRRNLVAAAALLPIAAFASGTFAQEAAPPVTTDPGNSDGDAMGEAEVTHAEQTGIVGSLSLLQSRAAATMASNEKVKRFAMWEVAEQETIGDILKSMKAGAEQAQGTLALPTDEEAMAMLEEADKSKLEEMKSLSGAEFDQGYVAANLEGHQKLLAIQEEYLTAGTNREHISIAKLARGMITEHIAHLEELQAATA